MTSEQERTLPWSLADARTIFLTTTVGAALLGWAWWDASGTGKLDDQTSSMALGVFAGVIVVAGAVAWLTAGRRAVRIRRSHLMARLDEDELVPIPEVESHTSDAFVAIATSTRYHRADCLLARGKDVTRLTRLDGHAPCEMCRP